MNKNGLQVLENIHAAQRLILMTGVDIILAFLTARCGSRSNQIIQKRYQFQFMMVLGRGLIW